MKHLFLFLLFLIPVLLSAQDPLPANPRKLRLGYQTDGEGIVLYGSGVPSYTPTRYRSAFHYMDTTNNIYYQYNRIEAKWDTILAGAGAVADGVSVDNSTWSKIGGTDVQQALTKTDSLLGTIEEGATEIVVQTPTADSSRLKIYRNPAADSAAMIVDTRIGGAEELKTQDEVATVTALPSKRGYNGQLLTTRAYSASVDRSRAYYRVASDTAGLTYVDDGIGLVELANGNFALIEFPGDEINIRWFGAVGDGTTVDSAAVKKAIAWHEVYGGKLFIPKGSYNLGGANLTLPASSWIKFGGGTLKNGTLTGSNTNVEAGTVQIFDDIEIDTAGTWRNEKGYIEWWVGTETQDSLSNWQALKGIVTMNAEVIVNDLYPIWTAQTDVSYSDNPIRITGKSRDTTGFILCREFGSGFGYFRHPKGNSVDIKGITLVTRKHLNGVLTQGGGQSDYLFVQAVKSGTNPTANPDIDYIKFDNCNIFGDVYLRYVFTDTTLLDSNDRVADYISRTAELLYINNCRFENIGDFIDVRDYPIRYAVVTNNVIRDLYGVLYTNTQVPDGGAGWINTDTLDIRAQAIISGNNWENTRIFDPLSTYVTLVQPWSMEVIFSNNVIKNIMLNTTDNVAYAVRPTTSRAARVFKIENNTIINVLTNRTVNNAFIENKGNANMDIINNRIIITKQALVDVGVIDSVQQDLTTLPNTFWRFSLFEGSDEFYDSTQVRVIGNYMETPVLNATGYIQSEKIEFVDNVFKFNYLLDPSGVYPEDVSGVLLTYANPGFNFDGALRFRGNTFFVDTSNVSVFIPMNLGDADTATYPYMETVEYFGNTVIADNLDVVWGVYKSANLSISNNLVSGDKVSMYSNISQGLATKRDLIVDAHEVNYHSTSYFLNEPCVLHNQYIAHTKGKYRWIADNNQDSVILLFSTTLPNTNSVQNENVPIGMQVTGNFLMKNGQRKTLNYRIAWDDNSGFFYYDQDSSAVQEIVAYYSTGTPGDSLTRRVSPIDALPDDAIYLGVGRRAKNCSLVNQRGYILFKGTDDVLSFTVDLDVRTVETTGNVTTFLTNWVTPDLSTPILPDTGGNLPTTGQIPVANADSTWSWGLSPAFDGGSLYITDADPDTLDFSASGGIYQQIQDLQATALDNFTELSDSLIYGRSLTRPFTLNFSVTVEGDTGSTFYNLEVKRNGTAITGCRVSEEYPSAGVEQNISGSCRVDLGDSDALTLEIMTPSASSQVIVRKANLTVH